MKYLFSISLILIYFVGSFQSSWVLVDFYWNRDDYTQKYCQVLDQGITQCHASCYLEELLKEEHNDSSEAKIISTQKIKVVEISSNQDINFQTLIKFNNHLKEYLSDQYQFDILHFIFHPPKA